MPNPPPQQPNPSDFVGIIKDLPDVDGELRSEALYLQRIKRDAEHLKQHRYGDDTKHREDLVYWTMFIVTGWLIAVLAVLFLNAPYKLMLSEGVLTALLVTTTANILGLAYIVLRGHFNGSPKEETLENN